MCERAIKIPFLLWPSQPSPVLSWFVGWIAPWNAHTRTSRTIKLKCFQTPIIKWQTLIESYIGEFGLCFCISSFIYDLIRQSNHKASIRYGSFNHLSISNILIVSTSNQTQLGAGFLSNDLFNVTFAVVRPKYRKYSVANANFIIISCLIISWTTKHSEGIYAIRHVLDTQRFFFFATE